MRKIIDKNNRGMYEGKVYYGFLLKRIVRLSLINAYFFELEHKNTGAKYIHISNDDNENTFSVAFKTVPKDSTGVAHILEHCVLCGSQKYPVRDPFFSMLKRSLSTFMNAFTSSDWTMYPFSTQNKKDFFNLMDVYLDAVFSPKLSELSFKQEGHRIEFDDNDNNDNLIYKGVVYNEMKGAMSSPDQVMERYLMNALYPLTTYKNNSGGEPAQIPTLSYEELKAFHRQHYHPSNAFFYTYGNLPLEEHLFFIEENVLKLFNRIDPKTDVISQPRWKKPKQAVYKYPISEDEDPSQKYQICLAWLTADINDSFEVLILTLLTRILLANSASPLHKALIDSQLGSALSDGTGFSADNKDTMFVCGLKGVKKSSAEKIESTIFDVLTGLVENGIDKDLIDAAIHQLEFGRKEVTNYPYPYGLKLILQFSGTWFHGGDSISIIEIDSYLKKLTDKLKKGSFFENRIEKYFINNQHRLLFILEPDKKIDQEENERVKKELQKIKRRLQLEDIKNIKQNTYTLAAVQSAKEDVSCLPTLQLTDIPYTVHVVKEKSFDKTKDLFCYEQPVSGTFYFISVAGVGMLEKKLLSMLPFFCYAFTKTGTTKRDYIEIAKLLDSYTGGIGILPSANLLFDKPDFCLPFVSFGGKSLVRNQKKLFDIMIELLTCFSVSDHNRLKNLLMEYKAGLESMIIHNGHSLAISLASRNFSKKCALNELWHGVHQFRYIKELTKDLSALQLERIAKALEKISKTIFSKNNFKMAVIGEEKSLLESLELAAILREELMDKGVNGFNQPKIQTEDVIPYEGWDTSSAVSFTAQTFQTVPMIHEDSPALSVISRLLRMLYLHKEIREKGGAYAGFSIYNLDDGIFNLASYRDPHIVSTLSTFSNAASFIKDADNYDKEDIKEAIFQICSDIDKPDVPGTAAQKSFFRKLTSLSDEAREHFKKQLFTVDRSKVLETAEKYFSNKNTHAVAVISSVQKLKEANEKLEESQLKLYKI